MKSPDYRKVFTPDDGALLELRVFGTNLNGWESLIAFLSGNYLVIYSEDGIETPLPEAKIIFLRRAEKTVMLEVMLLGFTVNCHFFLIDQIQMNLLPENINTKAKADPVFELMTQISSLLGKDVFLTPEFGDATAEQLQRIAVCTVRSGRPENHKQIVKTEHI